MKLRNIISSPTRKKLLIVILNLISLAAHATSAFLVKPQGFYSMHYLRPQDDYIQRCEQPCFLNATLAYHQSSNGKDIARALFGTDKLRFVGSALSQQPGDLVADNFGLAANFMGTLSFSPTIKTVTLDFFHHLTLTNFCEQLFIEFSAPLVFTQWELNAREHIQQRGSLTFPPCEMGPSPLAIPTASSILQALSGNFLFGDMEEPWYNGKFVNEAQRKTRLADITIAIGYNFYVSEVFKLTASILTIMPTGNHFQPTTVFYPVVGNASHWELGASITANAHYEWDTENKINGYLIGTFTHPFDNQQRRSFDFIGQGPLSRYMLLQAFNDTEGTLVYDQELINAINFTTRCVEVDCGIEGDFVTKLTYQRKHAIIEGGYTLYGRTNEHIHLSCFKLPCSTQGNFYAFKQPSVCITTQPTHILTSGDLDAHSAEIPASTVQTVFLQGGYQWEGCCAESALLLGISGTVGSVGCYNALNEWSLWTQFRIRF